MLKRLLEDRHKPRWASVILCEANGTPWMYPVTIITVRYGGVYEGGPWAAFHCYPEDMPGAVTGDDTECSAWWADHKDSAYLGVGKTPELALKALTERMQVAIDRFKEETSASQESGAGK